MTGDAQQMAEMFLKELVDLLALPACERLGHDVALVVTGPPTHAASTPDATWTRTGSPSWRSSA
ncbi:hypothetical protein ACWD62_19330 [Streptomyces sp. NPDC005146]